MKVGYELLSQVVGLELQIEESRVIEVPSGTLTEIVLRIDEEDVEVSSFGLLFALGVMSFADARPRGDSEADYLEQDQWTVEDFMRSLSFSRGRLCLETDYVRGRMMKTHVTIDQTGLVKLHTRGRGSVAETWIAKLQGKKTLSLVR